ncbi:MAG: anthranilate phosphoribosyltransferase [Coriobacteriia bacterium]|nr:anthranilate phosphoribosyltransferase [Coriobacteriia bacterium]
MEPQEFGAYITRLIRGEDLSRLETVACFTDILLDRQSAMQQGAFLAALAAKGETTEEVAGAWQTIYEQDTVKVKIDTREPLVENSGTGMDAVKTFNISTAAALIAAADGIPIARHGSRAITSACGAVDILEAVGVNVECPPDVVKRSVEVAGIGIFNGNSRHTHPHALVRILKQLSFGTVLNLAASLANPAQPRVAVRGVHSLSLLRTTAQTMHEIGYSRALVVYGEAEYGCAGGIDEASTMGLSHICELWPDGSIKETVLDPRHMGIRPSRAADLAIERSKRREADRMLRLLMGQETRARTDIACLNAGLILYIAGHQPSIEAGYRRGLELVSTKRPINKLIDWVNVQK